MASKVRISLEFGYTQFFAHNSYGSVDGSDIDWDDLKPAAQARMLEDHKDDKDFQELVAEYGEETALIEWEVVEVQGSCEGKRCWAQGYWEEEMELEDWDKELKANPNLLKELKALGMKVVKFSEEEEL